MKYAHVLVLFGSLSISLKKNEKNWQVWKCKVEGAYVVAESDKSKGDLISECIFILLLSLDLQNQCPSSFELEIWFDVQKFEKNAGRSDSDFALFIKDDTKVKVKIPPENNKPPFW